MYFKIEEHRSLFLKMMEKAGLKAIITNGKLSIWVVHRDILAQLVNDSPLRNCDYSQYLITQERFTFVFKK